MTFPRLAAAALLVAAALAPLPAAAADGADNCTAFIDAVPATVTTPGKYCLRANLDLVSSVYGAILVQSDDVTIDCNGFGLRTATPYANANSGVRADGPSRLTVRNCRLLGFLAGVLTTYGDGHLVEDNLVRDSNNYGIAVTGARSVVRRNRVLDTTSTYMPGIRGIEAGGEIVDNVVIGVRTTAGEDYSIGIYGYLPGAYIRGNIVRDVGNLGIGVAVQGTIVDNHVVGSGYGSGLAGNGFESCARNTVYGFATAVDCDQATANLEL